MQLPPTLSDGLVTLRVHRPSDAPRIVEQSVDEESVRWTTVPSPYTSRDAERFLAEVMPRGWMEGTEWGFAVEVEGRYAGTVSLRERGPRRAEVAYGAHPDVRGTGTMERALRLLLTWGFDPVSGQGLETVIWWANRGNWASRRLAWKVGFSFDGAVRGWLDHRGRAVDGWVGTLRAGEAMASRTTWLSAPEIVGEGVRLRPLTEADVPRLVEGLGDPETQRLLPFLPRSPGEAEALGYLEQARERHADASCVTWGFSELDPGAGAGAGAGESELAGVVGLYRFPTPELGYWTHPSRRGQGLTRRAAALATTHAFGPLGLSRLAASAVDPNGASLALLDRLGFRRTGVQRQAVRLGDGEVVDLVEHDLLAEEWLGEAT